MVSPEGGPDADGSAPRRERGTQGAVSVSAANMHFRESQETTKGAFCLMQNVQVSVVPNPKTKHQILFLV